jgi:hypothetical protein
MSSEAPAVGELLPRAAEAYTVPEKFAWILSEDDTQRFWSAIAQAVLDAPTIYKVDDRTPFGLVCGVETTLAIGERTAKARTFWHYKHARDAPRLVTAYPRL